MSTRRRTRSQHSDTVADRRFSNLQKELLRKIYDHDLSHESLGGVRGLVESPSKVFSDNSNFWKLYECLREINPKILELGGKDEKVAETGFRDSILYHPNDKKRARILTVLLDLNIPPTSNTWTEFARHLNVLDPSNGHGELCDENLPLSRDQIKRLLGPEHSENIYNMQYKYCVPLTDGFGPIARKLEAAIGEQFFLPLDGNGNSVREVHVEYFCPNGGPVHVVRTNRTLIEQFFIACNVARILDSGEKKIAKHYEHKMAAEANAPNFFRGVESRAKILAILLHIGLYSTDLAWDHFFKICLEPSPPEGARDVMQDSVRPNRMDNSITDKSLPLDDAQSVINMFGLDKHHAMKFLKDQYLFCAAVLDEGKEKDISPNTLLPLSRKEEIGGGAGGQVYAVTIAKEHIDNHGRLNSHTENLAMKRSSRENRNDWKQLLWVFKQTLQHDCITRARGALTSTTNSFVFFTRADLDLHKFMEAEENWEKWASDTKAKQKMLLKMRNIADAIKYLHFDLENDNLEHIAYFHRDLRADNILVTEQDGDLQLRITDFGLSSITESFEDQSAAGFSPSLGRILTDVRIGQNCSNYPPEAVNKKIDSRADIWAFGTVLAEFIAWLSGGSKSLMDYKRARQKKAYEWSFELNEHQRPVLRTTIEPFFDKIIEQASEDGERRLYDSSWSLLNQGVLKCQPANRLGIREIVKILSDICTGKEIDPIFGLNVYKSRQQGELSTISTAPQIQPTESVGQIISPSPSNAEPPRARTFSEGLQHRISGTGKQKRDVFSKLKRAASKDHAKHAESAQSGNDSNPEYQHHSTLPSTSESSLRNERESALYRAASEGKSEDIKKLKDSGVNLDHQDKKERTPLMLALSGGHVEAAATLLDLDADPSICNDFGRNALYFSIDLEGTGIPERILSRYPELKDNCDKDGKTVLHTCAERCTNKSVAMADLLIRHHCNVNVEDAEQRTPLSIATDRHANPRARALVDLLKRHGAKWGSGRKGEHRKEFGLD